MRQQLISENVTYVVFSLDGLITGESGRNFVSDVREERQSLLDSMNVGSDATLMVAGFSAYSLDVQDAIVENLPIAIAFIFISTIILIYIQVRSIVIPIKAIVMNILSISASFGMLVFVFQWGNGAEHSKFHTTTNRNDKSSDYVLHCIWSVYGLRGIDAISHS